MLTRPTTGHVVALSALPGTGRPLPLHSCLKPGQPAESRVWGSTWCSATRERTTRLFSSESTTDLRTAVSPTYWTLQTKLQNSQRSNRPSQMSRNPFVLVTRELGGQETGTPEREPRGGSHAPCRAHAAQLASSPPRHGRCARSHSIFSSSASRQASPGLRCSHAAVAEAERPRSECEPLSQGWFRASLSPRNVAFCPWLTARDPL